MRWFWILTLCCLPSCTAFMRKPVAPVVPKGEYRIDQAAAEALQAADAHIEIDLCKQEMTLLNKDDQEVVWTQVSTGRKSSPTPTGDFKVLEKLPTKFSNRYGKWVKPDTREVLVWRIWEHTGPQPPGSVYEGYEMKHWLRLTWPGVGIHHGDFKPGELSSKGCIRTPEEPQQVIWEHAKVGTNVRITGSSAALPDAP